MYEIFEHLLQKFGVTPYKVSKQTGLHIGRKLTIHSLRHTHASLMMENGMDEQSIARRLGHTSSKVTKEIYLHVTKKMQEKENQKIKSIRILN